MVLVSSVLCCRGRTNGISQQGGSFDRLEDECIEWQRHDRALSLALRMMKAGFNAELDGQAGIQELAGDATMLYYTLDEAQEGGKAFLEKRKPDFDKYPQFP